jgi:hypothetical protein
MAKKKELSREDIIGLLTQMQGKFLGDGLRTAIPVDDLLKVLVPVVQVPAALNDFVHFPNGLTVTELKEMVKDWPEQDELGEPCGVWVTTGEGLSSPVTTAVSLNRRVFDDMVTVSADLLLETNAFK